MTIDELRTRRRERLARKKEELELQAAGRGDNFALFMVQEELMDVNAQLRTLMPGHRVGVRTTGSPWAPDRQQYIDWKREDQSLNDEIEDGRRAMLQAVSRSLEILTPRQREILELRQSGMKMDTIAAKLGVTCSTVSRTLGRAKRSVREEAERAMQASSLAARLDMADPATAKVILSALTAKQAAYLYLYYSEWLSLREISELTGTNHAAILRTIQRALRNIGSVLGYREAVLENIDALGDLAYQLYCEIQDLDNIVPLEQRPLRETPCPVSSAKPPESFAGRTDERPPITVRTSGGYTARVQDREVTHRYGRGRHGRLLSALLDRARSQAAGGHPILRWLVAVFQRLAGNDKREVRWWNRIFSRKGSRS